MSFVNPHTPPVNDHVMHKLDAKNPRHLLRRIDYSRLWSRIRLHPHSAEQTCRSPGPALKICGGIARGEKGRFGLRARGKSQGLLIVCRDSSLKQTSPPSLACCLHTIHHHHSLSNSQQSGSIAHTLLRSPHTTHSLLAQVIRPA